jgi:hypothetical protein
MRRHFIIATVVAVATLLAVPAVTQASGSWGVQSKGGTRVGTIVQVSGSHWHVLNDDGKEVGEVDRNGENWVATRSSGRLASVTRVVASADLSVDTSAGGRGSARIRNARWQLRRRVDGAWVKRGSVPGACHGAAAAGALFILLW